MTAAHYREQARQALEAGRQAGILPERAGLVWRTHDHGLLEFDAHRLEESLLAQLRSHLGSSRQAAPEMAALPLSLLYCLTGKGPGTLPGRGTLMEWRGLQICLSADPLACVRMLAEAEQRARQVVLGRLLDSPDTHIPLEVDAGEETGSCGQCGGLLGCSACAGSACVRHH